MNFTANRTELLNGLLLASKPIGTNVIIPILECIRFEVTAEKLTLTGSNAEISVSTSIVLKTDITADIAIPAARLIGLIKDLPDQPLTFTIENERVIIKSTSGKYTIPIENGKDFPVSKVKGKQTFEIETKALMNGIDKTLFSVNDKINVEDLIGLSVEIGNGILTTTGCDRFTLSNNKEVISNKSEAKFHIPAKAVKMVYDIANGETSKVSYCDKSISFEFANCSINCALLATAYVNYVPVLPKDNQNILKIDRSILMGALKRVSQFAPVTNAVALTLAPGELKISSKNVMEEEADEVLACDYSGEEIVYGLNGGLFLNCLMKHECPEIKLSFKDSVTAARIEDEINENLLMIIMPIRL